MKYMIGHVCIDSIDRLSLIAIESLSAPSRLIVWKPSVQANKMCAESQPPLEPNKVAKKGAQRGRGSAKGGNKGRWVAPAAPKAETILSKAKGRGRRKS
eukprot:2103145-Amphidinium_carterae.1